MHTSGYANSAPPTVSDWLVVTPADANINYYCSPISEVDIWPSEVHGGPYARCNDTMSKFRFTLQSWHETYVR